MFRGRRLRRFLTAELVLAGTVVCAAPAAVAAPCGGPTCYRSYADITITAWTDPSIPIPVLPGSTHSYTVRVTNTGWRAGGASGPIPGLGPDSGTVYVAFVPSSPDEYPLGTHYDSGVRFSCQGYRANGLACETGSIPTGTTSQFTAVFQAPRTLGTYTCTVFAYALGWTEYDPNNNSVPLAYQVGYQA
jgi:hypothetical protein